MNAWLMAIRPKTLPAGAAPVILGMALAYSQGKFTAIPAVVALVCAVMMQIVSNLLNDVYDFRKGADTAERLGPPRAVASGVLTEKAVKHTAWVLAVSAFCLGQYLVWVGGWEILVIGVLALGTAWAYTGGPFPLAYLGLGEICAFVFFGVIAVSGTYYVQAHEWSWIVLLFSFVPAFWSANILLVNNIRDIRTDSVVGKKTLAVRIGNQNARILYCAAAGAAVLVPVVYLVFAWDWSLLVSFLVMPFVVEACRNALMLEGRALNELLLQTVRLLILHTVLISFALVIRTMMLS